MNAISCRSCKLDYNVDEIARHHNQITLELQCPLCNQAGIWSSHIDDALWGDSLECVGCDNYILYVSPEGQIWKDEIYLQGDRVLIRDLENNTSTLCSSLICTKTICKLDHIIQFQDLVQLERRAKTMEIFS